MIEAHFIISLVVISFLCTTFFVAALMIAQIALKPRYGDVDSFGSRAPLIVSEMAQDFDSRLIDGNTTRDTFNCQDPVTQSSRFPLWLNY